MRDAGADECEAPQDDEEGKRAAQERRESAGKERPLEERIKYGFYRVYKPVLDDAPWRSFNSTAEYRAWCEANLPEYLGYNRVSALGI